MQTIRQMTQIAQNENRFHSGVFMDGSAFQTLNYAGADRVLRVRAFGPFCTMIYYLDGSEVTYRDACALIRDARHA